MSYLKFNFSPEKHGVLRFGENLSARPTMPKDLYQTLVRDNNKNHTLSDRCVSDLAVIDGIIKKMVKKVLLGSNFFDSVLKFKI